MHLGLRRRRRCRASARRRSAASACARATSRARPSAGCRPRASRPGSSSRPYLSCSRSAQSAAKRRSAPRRDQAQPLHAPSEASATLRSIEKSITRPCCRRSSGTSADAGRHRRRRRARREAPAVDLDRAGVPAVDAEDRARDLAAARADEARERDDLAAAHVERDVGEDALARQPVDLQHDAARLASAPSGRARPCRARPSRG